jgi:hypothetical protein
VEDLKEFLGACIVVRHPHGEEEVEWTSLEKHEEETVLYTSDTHVVDGKTCNVTVTGGFNSGMMGADPELTGWGRSGGVWVWVQCVWEGQLKELVCEVGFADMQRAGYKGGWDLMDDNGFLYWKMEHRHVSRLLKNLVFRWEGGDEEAKGDVALKWIGGRPAIYKNAGGYVGGEFCFSSFFFEKPGVLKVRCMKAAGGGTVGEMEISEHELVTAGWLELARNIANSSEGGLKSFLEVLYWAWEEEEEGEEGAGKEVLRLKKNEFGDGGCVDDDDVVLTQCIYKSAMRVEDKVLFVKISTFNERKECRGLKGDDGLCFDLTGWGGDIGEGDNMRCVINRSELEEEYGVVLMDRCGVGKSLNRIPRHTLMMLLGRLRQNSEGSRADD